MLKERDIGRQKDFCIKKEMKNRFSSLWDVPGTGVEPASPCGHMNLNHARLPIPPSGHFELQKYKNN